MTAAASRAAQETAENARTPGAERLSPGAGAGADPHGASLPAGNFERRHCELAALARSVVEPAKLEALGASERMELLESYSRGVLDSHELAGHARRQLSEAQRQLQVLSHSFDQAQKLDLGLAAGQLDVRGSDTAQKSAS